MSTGAKASGTFQQQVVRSTTKISVEGGVVKGEEGILGLPHGQRALYPLRCDARDPPQLGEEEFRIRGGDLRHAMQGLMARGRTI